MRPQSPPGTKYQTLNNHGAGASLHHHPLPNAASPFQNEYAQNIAKG